MAQRARTSNTRYEGEGSAALLSLCSTRQREGENGTCVLWLGGEGVGDKLVLLGSLADEHGAGEWGLGAAGLYLEFWGQF